MANGSDHFTKIANELLNRIIDLARRPLDTEFTDNADLCNISLTCHALHKVSGAMRFENMVLRLNLKRTDLRLPAPLEWRKTRLETYLEQSPDNAQQIKAIQIVVEPFPLQHWSDEELEQLRLEIAVGRDPKGLELYKELPRSQARRQEIVAEAFALVFRPHAHAHAQTAADATLAVRQILVQLPELKHLEPGPWRVHATSNRDSVAVLQHASYLYASGLVLAARPRSVTSAQLRRLRPGTEGEHDRRGDGPIFTQSDGDLGVRLPEPILNRAIDVQPSPPNWLTTLQLGVYVPTCRDLARQPSHQRATHLNRHINRELRPWQTILRMIPNLETLILHYIHRNEQVRDKQYLEMLMEGVQPTLVTHLSLRNWTIAEPYISDTLVPKFLRLKSLSLEEVLLKPEPGHNWEDAVKMLVQCLDDGIHLTIENVRGVWADGAMRAKAPKTQDLCDKLVRKRDRRRQREVGQSASGTT